jgi:hypothetical protein
MAPTTCSCRLGKTSEGTLFELGVPLGAMAAATGRPNFALAAFVEPCETPTLFAHLKRCDLHGVTEEEARARLKAFLEPAQKPPRGPFSGMAKSSASPATTPPHGGAARDHPSTVAVRTNL